MTCDEKRTQLQKTVLEGALRGIALEYAYDPIDLSEKEIAMVLGQIFDVVVPPEPPAQGRSRTTDPSARKRKE
jgi:hypothetical protein